MSSQKILVFSPLRQLVSGLLLVGGLSLQAQSVPESQVPAAAVASLKKAVPGLAATWQLGPQNAYEASFSREGQDNTYVYDQAGVLQTKKIKSSVTQFPAGVQKTVAAYPGAKVEAAYKVMTRTQEKYYEVQLASAEGRDRLRFDLEGKPTGKVSLASSKPAPAAPVAAKPSAPAPAPTAAAPKPVAQPVAAVSKPTPQPVAKPTPAPAAKPVTPSAPMAMRGESATSAAKPAAVKDDLDDDSLDDQLDIEEDENWEDLNDDLDEEVEEDDDLLLEEEEEEWEELEDDDDDLDDLN